MADLDSLPNIMDFDPGSTRPWPSGERLGELVQQLLRVQEMAGLGARQVDIARDQVDWIGETYRMFGFAGSDPRSFSEALEHAHPEDRPRVLQAWEAALASPGASFEATYRLRVSGEERLVRERAQIERDAGGRAVRALATVQDVTYGAPNGAALEDHQQRLEAALEAANAGAWEWNVGDETLRVSEGWARMLGYSGDEVACLAPTEQERLAHPGDRDRVVAARNDCLAGRAPALQVEYRIRHRDGHWIWVRSAGRIIRRDEAGKPLVLAGIDIDISRQRLQEEQLAYIASHDELTGLPNRKAFAWRLMDLMQQCPGRGERLAVAYIDVDGLAEINRIRGRDFGDRLIKEFTRRLVAICGEADVARTGGDEFACVLHGTAADREFSIVIERLLARLSAPAGDEKFVTTASIGVATYPQHTSIDAEQLLRQADQAMYQSKLSGKNCYTFFDAERDENTREYRAQLEEIRRGIADRQFLLHYQPKVDMRAAEVLGFEALVRWQHPGKGLLLPARFIPLLENHPLAIELGDQVIEMALAQLDAWNAAGFETSVSVNVTSVQLHDPEFIARLERQFKAHPRVRPAQLGVEVVETGAMQDMGRVGALVARLDEIGVNVALDDFGTGFSSLTFLKQLPARIVKIDQSFVRDLLDDQEHAVIVDSICGLAESFDRLVIAEGVETEVHGRLLLELGCDLGQGFAIARPMPAVEVKDWAESWRPPETWADCDELGRDRLPELLAELGHRAWRNALRNYLDGNRKTPPEMDAACCRLGSWLESPEIVTSLGGHRDFGLAVDLHRQSHVAARHAVAAAEAGSDRSSEQLLDTFFQFSNQLLDHLKMLRKRP